TASRSISSPPARLIAPATPAPIHRWSLAAFPIASTSSDVMSPSTTSSSSTRGRLSSAGDRELRLVGEAGKCLQRPLAEVLGRRRPRDEEAHAAAVEPERRDPEH